MEVNIQSFHAILAKMNTLLKLNCWLLSGIFVESLEMSSMELSCTMEHTKGNYEVNSQAGCLKAGALSH